MSDSGGDLTTNEMAREEQKPNYHKIFEKKNKIKRDENQRQNIKIRNFLIKLRRIFEWKAKI